MRRVFRRGAAEFEYFRCFSSYEFVFSTLASMKMVLITHVGDEHSVRGSGIDDAMGNPALFEPWLKKYPDLKIIFTRRQ